MYDTVDYQVYAYETSYAKAQLDRFEVGDPTGRVPGEPLIPFHCHIDKDAVGVGISKDLSELNDNKKMSTIMSNGVVFTGLGAYWYGHFGYSVMPDVSYRVP